MTARTELPQAACRPPEDATLLDIFHNANIFFKDENRNAAKAICFTCPEQAECLRLGLREPGGVWGGLGETERSNLAALLEAQGLEL